MIKCIQNVRGKGSLIDVNFAQTVSKTAIWEFPREFGTTFLFVIQDGGGGGRDGHIERLLWMHQLMRNCFPIKATTENSI